MTKFDFGPIRSVAIDLVKQFGRTAPCVLLRAVEAPPADASTPWRRGTPTRIDQFPFIGVVSTLGFPKRANPQTDHDLDLIIPGDLTSTTSSLDGKTLCGPPTLTDRLQVTYLGATSQYSIIGIQDITPDDLVIIFKVRCKAFCEIIGQPAGGF